MLRSQLVKNKARLGPGPSRNVGIKQGDSKWITFLDGDDTYKENIFHYIPSDSEKDLVITTVQSWHGYIYQPTECLSTSLGLIVKRTVIEENNIYFPEIRWAGEDTLFRTLLFAVIPESNRAIYSTTFYKHENNPASIFMRPKDMSLFKWPNEEKKADEITCLHWLITMYDYLSSHKNIATKINWFTIFKACNKVCDWTSVNNYLFFMKIIFERIGFGTVLKYKPTPRLLFSIIFFRRYCTIKDNYIIFNPNVDNEYYNWMQKYKQFTDSPLFENNFYTNIPTIWDTNLIKEQAKMGYQDHFQRRTNSIN